MPNFIVPFESSANRKARRFRGLFTGEHKAEEEKLYRLFQEGNHWHPLPEGKSTHRPAMAVDGGLRTLELANGSVLIIAQALLIGDAVEDAQVDIEILRGNVPRSTTERFADLFRQRLEVDLASKHMGELGSDGVMLLDGALYSSLPQLYPLRSEGLEEVRGEDAKDLIEHLVDGYRALFDCCDSGPLLVSIAKSSRETLLSDLLQGDTPEMERLRIPDSEIIFRWTEQKAGFSSPVLLGTRSFRDGSSRVLIESDSPVAKMPAILSFFIRPVDFAPAFRVDVPGACVGRTEKIEDVDAQLCDPGQVGGVLRTLLADYGGPAVYNALLYTADRQVRLSSDRFFSVYLPLLQGILEVELNPTFSAQRFL